MTQDALDTKLQDMFDRFGEKCDKQDEKIDKQAEQFDKQHEELVKLTSMFEDTKIFKEETINFIKTW